MTSFRNKVIEPVQITDLASEVSETELASSAYKMSLWEGELSTTIYLSRDSKELENSDATLNLIFEDGAVSSDTTTGGDSNLTDTIVNKISHRISHPFFNSFDLSEFSIKTLEYNDNAAMIILFNDQLKKFIYLEFERSNLPQNIDPIIIDQLEGLELENFYTTNLIKRSKGEIDLLIDGDRKVIFQENREPQITAADDEQQSCEAGSMLLNGKCEESSSSNQVCSIDNGIGKKMASGSDSSACEVVSCDSGYSQNGNTCIASKMACKVENGIGEQFFSDGDYGVCEVTRCNSGYSQQGNDCLAPKIACPVQNGTGERMFSGEDYGTCQVTSCDSGYLQKENTCISNPDLVKSSNVCKLDHGVGVAVYRNGVFAACYATSCDAGYGIFKNKCKPNKLLCDIDNGTGYRHLVNGEYEKNCRITCDSGYSLAGTMRCVSDKFNLPGSVGDHCVHGNKTYNHGQDLQFFSHRLGSASLQGRIGHAVHTFESTRRCLNGTWMRYQYNSNSGDFEWREQRGYSNRATTQTLSKDLIKETGKSCGSIPHRARISQRTEETKHGVREHLIAQCLDGTLVPAPEIILEKSSQGLLWKSYSKDYTPRAFKKATYALYEVFMVSDLDSVTLSLLEDVTFNYMGIPVKYKDGKVILPPGTELFEVVWEPYKSEFATCEKYSEGDTQDSTSLAHSRSVLAGNCAMAFYAHPTVRSGTLNSLKDNGDPFKIPTKNPFIDSNGTIMNKVGEGLKALK